MIPVKLKMRNFMPYRGDVPPFSFAGIHTACICGDNGNGKSALIDAITWALWGKTRAKSDDELIHLGENEIEVEFDFTVGQQQYRIIRKHAKPKKQTGSGQSSLDLFLASDDGFKAISGDRIIQTQQKIIDLLHMDYETFVNSAFLRQGHADEFTKQPPAKRKEVLANILGLSLYDQLEEQAKELSRQQHIEKTQLDNSIKDIDQELAQKPEIEIELEQSLKVSAYLDKEIKEQELRLNQLRQERQSLKNKKLQLAQLEEYIYATKRELERRQEEIKQHSSRIKEYEELIAIRPSIEEGYSQFIQAKQLNQELNQKLQLVDRIKDRKIQLEQAIQKAQAGLLADHAVSQSKVTELEAISKRLPQLKNELLKLESERLRLAEPDEELEKKRKQEQELQTIVHELIYTKERLQQEIKEIEEKISLLYRQGDARCPLCETELGQEGLNVIKTKYDADRNNKTDSLKANEAELANKKIELESARKEVYQLESSLNEDRASIQGKTGLLTQAVHEAEETDKKLIKEREVLAEIEIRLAAKDFAAQEQEALGEIEKELSSLKYDSSQHQKVSQQLSSLEKYEQQKRNLEEAERLISREKEALVKAEESARELHHRLESDSQKSQTMFSELNALPQLESELEQAEAEYLNLAERQKQSQEITGSLKGKLEHLQKQETKRKENESRLSQVAKEEKIYNDLAQAFGKKGIQAMLIEMALPEIEIEANRLLGRMTDNRMHVKIEAQRHSKKGELLETLDIKISDELGMRSYEMFSGGEAFRIDFALRIALSRLLAKRAGAPLPTLIIDEGFGTQDSTGMEKIKEAINSIQDDFDKIIVITHIEELKDAFPMRINVIKTAEGSTLEVS